MAGRLAIAKLNQSINLLTVALAKMANERHVYQISQAKVTTDRKWGVKLNWDDKKWTISVYKCMSINIMVVI